MGYPLAMGVHFDLADQEQIARAQHLASKDARKYEVVFGCGYDKTKTRLYMIAQGQEADQIVQWVQTGLNLE